MKGADAFSLFQPGETIMTRTDWLVLSLVAFMIARTDVSQAQGPRIPKPGPEHATLQKMEGTWDVALTLLGSVKTTGEATYKMQCGGLWLERDLKFTLGQTTIHTKGLETYDPVKKKYIGIQIDSMSTAPSIVEGTYDDAMTTLTQTGEARDFRGAPEQVKNVTKHTDDDHVVVDVYRILPDGKERKMLTIEYTRRKQAN
jgi:hypothetical protein